MSEIKFRGKTQNGEWVFGYYLPYHSVKDMTGKEVFAHIYQEPDEKHRNGWVLVKVETVGQCTGLEDKKRKKIYEGDIVRIISNVRNKNYDWFDDCSTPTIQREDQALVEWDKKNTGFRLKVYNKGKYKRIARFCRSHLIAYEAVVIGNIHDNPELLKE